MIASGPEAVWAVLTDGRLGRPGTPASTESTVRLRPVRRSRSGPRRRPAGLSLPKVTDFDPPAWLRFSGGMPLGLFRGVRTFEVSPDGTAGTTFRVSEEYTGPLLMRVWRSMPDLGPSFDRFAKGLKRRAETGR